MFLLNHFLSKNEKLGSLLFSSLLLSTLISLGIFSQSVNSHVLSQNSKKILINKLKERFSNSVLFKNESSTKDTPNKNKFETNLKAFQLDQLKKRNFMCQNETMNINQMDVSFLKFKKYSELAKIFKDFSSSDYLNLSITNDEITRFNKMVN
jgi:hypothetical protein